MKNRFLFFALLGGLFLGPLLFPAAVVAASEDDKANDLVNFTNYVDWPAKALGKAFSDFVFAVIGDEGVSKRLAETQKGKWLDGHPVAVQILKDFDPAQVKNLKQSQVLFISASQKDHLGNILKALRGKPVLTVSDMDGFTSQGGMIQLVQLDNRISIRINPDSIEKGKLKVSSKLMQIAQIEKTGE